ncbi:hypothetical protein HK100_010923 [Physocladia obscura]|uniref:CMP/dCMP-type deaminase domain-containing protein n=1 Tax=Physocladia obscura TaxID=109957 RepID=A0AAD5T3A0_9FUNG|nr:hypothetical protein HK100_010923 [Physocladia obscura]
MMQLAVEQAKQSPPSEGAYCVGAVLAAVDKTLSTATVLATGFSRELPGNTHAEECCFIKVREAQLKEARDSHKQLVIYTTMEPCGLRLSGKLPCANRILEAGYVERVVVAIREPPNFVESCTGAQLLQEKGLAVDFFDSFAGSS